ncbi:hypothetical protein F5B22DRAFT_81270 [Xylaria bambusicola]|uniref:uncharacterized protein n=1 Tax=Xylaria bambusicola TaxID=326684 RepID=UPI002007EFA9|nr:uncharacterized protein F5B22DRAFT_81270 [Xylaria bambusicola]KAI0518328.1 hypothetical protein F5B22DRAFT_81270 [Xylaria bambusicola]
MIGRQLPQNDQGSILQILLWFLFIVAILSVGARIGTKFYMTRKLARDDWILLAAQSAYLAQCVSISLGTSQGLGEPMSSLSQDAVERFLQAEYASFVFQLTALALIKWSISISIRQLSPSATHQRLDLVLRLSVGIWVLSAVLTTLFQCAFPSPWDYVHGSRCINRRAWWAYVAIGNIGTEFFIVAMYCMIIGNLRMSLMRRSVVLLIFSTRLLIIGIALAQLTFFLNAFPSADLTKDIWLPTVLNQAVLSASVVTACGPYLRPFMESLESGVARVLPESEEDLSHDRMGPSANHLSNYNSAACSQATDR